jgi:hypothetical protein
MDENGSVVFAEESSSTPTYEERSKMVDLAIRISGGLIKTKEQANYVLLGLVVLAFGISTLLLFRGQPPSMPKPPQAVLDQMSSPRRQ